MDRQNNRRQDKFGGPVYEKLAAYGASDFYAFHMPGHKRLMGEFENPFQIDITEIDGFDDLHHPENDGVRTEAQRRAAQVFGAGETHFLVNGSTAGILSAISGCTKYGGTLLMARNCHRSAYHGAELRGAKTVYLYPQYIPELGINGAILPEDVENALQKPIIEKKQQADGKTEKDSGGDREKIQNRIQTDIQAVMIVSPTYDGVCSDVRRIAGICHRYGVPLIVDQAHGAHFPFSKYFPEDAVSAGADVVIQSVHKTLPAMTQTALLHVQGEIANRERIRKFLSIYQSSSPSYIFMAAMDRCVEFLKNEGKERFEAFAARLEDFYAFIRELERIRIPGYEIRGDYGIFDFDRSKILLVPDAHGGEWLAEELRKKDHLELEMAAGGYGLALTSVMDTEEGFERLRKALNRIDGELADEEAACVGRVGAGVESALDRRSRSVGYDGVVHNEIVVSLREAYDGEKETVPLKESEGRISGEFLYLYPPGIPLLMPGERISRDVLGRVAFFQGFQSRGFGTTGRNL